MADVNPSAPVGDVKDPVYHHDEPVIAGGNFVRPSGWKYKEHRIGPITIPWYASPKVQLSMVAFVCFLCPGMFNALGGLGGGGNTDPTTADNMNTALYSTFSVFGFFGGTFVNKLGVKATMAFGGIGYCIYAIALLVSVHSSHVAGFNIFSGVLLGICAGLLWTAQGTIMISYPGEGQKGRYFGWFWGIFNMGGVVGALIPLGQNINVKTNSTVTDGTYIGFIVLMFCGAVLAVTLCNANDIIRPDGTRVVLMKNPSWKSEFIGLYETIKFEPYIILLFPMFWSSNWFYTYQQNAINGAYFDTRTKALNDVLYWGSQIVGAFLFGYALDIESVRRSVRAKAALGFLFALTMVVYGGGYAFAKTYTRASTNPKTSDFVPKDWQSSGYIGPMFLYIFYGFFDSAWQATIYWYSLPSPLYSVLESNKMHRFMGALSNSGRRSANIVGFYKGLQSAAAAVMWSLDSHKLAYMSEFASNWGLLAGSLVVAAPVIFLKIKDHVTVEEDLAGTDETLADVLPEGHIEKGAV
ncbi:hypothetical protein B7494_g640 [Chlorociboria aeruginascens]|nr:hypothetical protein B7494_g640 [Chlorociboria aeruginascens]